ncbi:MAG: 50S ribosomal protein L28 [Alphaproteobacteria bacterium]|jgi:large subunit ribosomal protein L28|nr:50S ribosomal protein L28 [Alphaproteobacteria bacterium]MBK9584742.1 50S ribosomal protein L28 [Alphaproteobacteria bacterium]MBP7763439.1 50S ribosomal protein L28 [Alphaproteobacteria bacterium]MBP7905619.1 50S ribosomal protein L28 [Alphaproteobacteria bacterium]QQS56560.1 MAG: 50S ribosomal protein L28 [Alphaproteobacteria bacterium]
MSRRCMITGKGAQTGHRVSHAQNKTKHRFLPNIQEVSLFSEALSRWVKLRVSVHGLRTVEHMGGLDSYLAQTAPTKLDPALRPVKAEVEKALAAKVAA